MWECPKSPNEKILNRRRKQGLDIARDDVTREYDRMFNPSFRRYCKNELGGMIALVISKLARVWEVGRVDRSNAPAIPDGERDSYAGSYHISK